MFGWSVGPQSHSSGPCVGELLPCKKDFRHFVFTIAYDSAIIPRRPIHRTLRSEDTRSLASAGSATR